MEKTLNEAFILAQKTAEEIHLNAKKEAALTLTQANQEREQILRSTKQEAASLQETIEELNRAKHHFLADLKGLLTSIWELAQNGRGPRSIPSLPLEEPTQPNEQEGLPVSPFIST
jgi:cell division septum initiation protein DivIVA